MRSANFLYRPGEGRGGVVGLIAVPRSASGVSLKNGAQRGRVLCLS